MIRLLASTVLITLALAGCAAPRYYPSRAGEPYPRHRHSTETADVQVFRDGTELELVNATPHTFNDFNLWINQRYVRHIDSLPAGARQRYSLWDFYDERGEIMNAGGFWRIYEPDPVRLVQMELDAQSPLIGLIAVREYRQSDDR